jgi:hypothetical protein
MGEMRRCRLLSRPALEMVPEKHGCFAISPSRGVLLRQGNLEEALLAAEAALEEAAFTADVLAIRFDAARRLARGGVPALDEDVLSLLDSWGYSRWVEALRAM